MKNVAWMLALLVGIALGGAAGWNVASMRVKNDMLFFMEQTADNDTIAQEGRAAQAYLKGSPEQAYSELKKLLETYGRYIDWPETIPGERAQRDGFATAIAHGRLANTCAKLGLTDEARFHLDQAIGHPRIGSEEKLITMLAAIDKAEGKQQGVFP